MHVVNEIAPLEHEVFAYDVPFDRRILVLSLLLANSQRQSVGPQRHREALLVIGLLRRVLEFVKDALLVITQMHRNEGGEGDGVPLRLSAQEPPQVGDIRVVGGVHHETLHACLVFSIADRFPNVCNCSLAFVLGVPSDRGGPQVLVEARHQLTHLVEWSGQRLRHPERSGLVSELQDLRVFVHALYLVELAGG